MDENSILILIIDYLKEFHAGDLEFILSLVAEIASSKEKIG